MSLQTVRVDRDGSVLTVTLNRPERLNAITIRLARELYSVLVAAGQDREIDVIVLTGAGSGFCAGVDAKGGDRQDPVPPDAALDRLTYSIPVLLHHMPQVTIAAINGSAGGAGLAWACSCDFRWAVATARFATAFLDRGVAADMCLHWTLPRLVGPGRARELLMLSPRIEATEALRFGLVEAVFESATFCNDVAARVARLAAAPSLALRSMKQSLVAAERLSMEDFQPVETLRQAELLRSPDAREGFAAFRAGRTPTFNRAEKNEGQANG